MASFSFMPKAKEIEAATAVVAQGGFKGKLKPYQGKGTAWMAKVEDRQHGAAPADGLGFGGILGDVMGLGKTVEMIALLCFTIGLSLQDGGSFHGSDMAALPTLIVVPLAVLENWRREIVKFSSVSERAIHLYYDSGRKGSRSSLLRKLSSSHVVITTYGVVESEAFKGRSDDVRLQAPLYNVRWSRIICDECHVARNSATKAWHSLMAFRRIQPRVFMWLLSGTLIHNDISDMVSYCMLLGLPEDTYASKRWWTRTTMAVTDKEDTSDAREAEEMMACFRERHLLARSKDSLPLPELTTIVDNVSLSDMEQHVYNTVYNNVVESFREYRRATGSAKFEAFSQILVQLMRLRQVVTHPALMLGAEEIHKYFSAMKSGGDDAYDKSAAIEMPSSKITWAINIIKSKKSGRFLVFSQWTAMLRLFEFHLEKEGIKSVTYDGSLSQSDREGVLAYWSSNDDVKVCALSLKAGGTGLNLTEADNVIILDPWYSPAPEDQAQDRSHRHGQTKPVTVYKAAASFGEGVVTRNPALQTIDHAIHALQDKKRRLSKMVVRGLGTMHREGGGGANEEDVCDIMTQLYNHTKARKDDAAMKKRHMKRKRR